MCHTHLMRGNLADVERTNTAFDVPAQRILHYPDFKWFMVIPRKDWAQGIYFEVCMKSEIVGLFVSVLAIEILIR